MFRTELHPRDPGASINLHDRLYLTGSCFSDHMGSRLTACKFNVLTNPFGIIYNPLSLFKLLDHALDNRPLPDEGYLHHQGLYRHFDLHSSISGLSREELEKKMQQALKASHHQLTKARWIIITLGTAIAFRHQATGAIVANCHKVPAREFESFFLSPEEIIDAFEDLFHKLKAVNPQAGIIFTLSPVRHIRSGLESNSVSKSILRYAIHRISGMHEGIYYFPSYEIMLDDLRDYRFFASDMVHISETAIEYIWQKFLDTWADRDTLRFIGDWQKMRKSLAHKPFRPGSPEHQAFLKETIKKLLTFKGKVDINEELRNLEKQLI